MNQRLEKLSRSLAFTVVAGALSAGVASAQTIQRPMGAVRPSSTIHVPPSSVPAFPVTSPKGPRAQPEVATTITTPAAQLVAAVVQRVTERFLEPGISLPGRGGLVDFGVYDR